MVKGLTRQDMFLVLMVTSLLGACAPDEAALELARIDGQTITLGQLHDFYDDMPEAVLSETTGVEKVRRHLQTLIDMELLKLAAVDRGVDRSELFLEKMHHYRKGRLVGLYMTAKIKVRPTVQEVTEYFEQGLSRTVRFGRILVANQDSAKAALEDLAAGSTFQEVALMWSIDEETARQGGDTGRFINRLVLPPKLSDPLFALELGEVSEPIAFDRNFGIFTAFDEMEVPLDRDRFKEAHQALAQQRIKAARQALVDSLRQALDLRIDREAVQGFVATVGAHRGEGLEELILCRYRGGQISGKFLLDSTSPGERVALTGENVDEVVARLETAVVPGRLLLAGAVAEGFGDDEETQRWLAKQRDQELIVQLRVRVMDQRIRISDEEVRREYENNRGRYTRPERLKLQEVLVATEAEAQKIRERIEQGEDMGALAAAHSIRPRNQRDAEGRLTVTLGDGRVFGRLVSNAWKATTGELVGPVAVHEGFTVLRVLARHKEPATFAEAKRRVRATVRWIMKQTVFDQFLQELRLEYADRVQIREDNLLQAVADG